MTDLFQQRRFTIQYAIIIVVSIFVARLFYIQIVDKDYKQLANANVLRQVTVFPARGLVYDRNGKLIIDNQKEYDLWVIPGQVKEMDTLGFCDLLGITDTFFLEEFDKVFDYFR